MRVYEIAEKLGVTNKEVLGVLHGCGEIVSGHMSSLTDEQEALVRSELQKRGDAIGKKSTAVAHRKKGGEKRSEKPPFIIRPMTVAAFADYLGVPSGGVILTLLRQGVVSTKNQALSKDVVASLAKHYELVVAKKSAAEKEAVLGEAISPQEGSDSRLPVVVVVGHVDHGKTTLLDFIRKTRAVSKEKGGITQHIGAYEAKTDHGHIVFLDTPGHEAFSRIRARGVGVADLVVLVVAADDGIMPQTVEAIKYAKDAKVPIVVAINKIDRAEASKIEIIKRELAQYDLLPEEWGGDIVCVPVSAKTGEGVDHLLEIIALQAELLELKADDSRQAQGYVLESRLEKGRGAVATVIGRHGVLRVGDLFVCGKVFGKVSSLVSSSGERVDSVGPSIPAVVAGFSAVPEVGTLFEVVSSEGLRQAKDFASLSGKASSDCRQAGTEEELVLIVKTDTNSTKEALLESINKLISKDKERCVNIVQASVGAINESDILLASGTGATILGLHVKADQNVSILARKKNVSILLSEIIYKLLEELEILFDRRKKVKLIKKKIGEAVVRKVFDIKGSGVIAGVYVKDGIFTGNGEVVAFRRGKRLGGGKIQSLQRDRKIVKEVHKGFECAFLISDFTDWQVDDTVECVIEVPEK
ncbi:translation initiation factor IF-2 [bacterium]|jgi:translation initiation factor IF-2|nr:translation initiation factor IF-2 [bacterium]